MTPPAVTFAGQGASSGSHRRAVRKRTAPSAPRRVSGPARPSGDRRVAAAGSAAAGATIRVTRPAPRRPPAPATAPRIRRRRRAVSANRPSGPLPARAAAFVRSLPDHRLLDRLVRGRAWIPLLGLMLAGIVAMQVEVLKLGANVGQSLQLSTTLQSRNQLLRANVAALADDQRIERIAAQMGMVMPPPTAAVFLAPRAGREVQRALSDIHQPDPTTFLASLPAATVTPSVQGASTATTTSTGTGQTAVSTPTAATTASTATGQTAVTTPTAATTTPTGGATTATGGAVSTPVYNGGAASATGGAQATSTDGSGTPVGAGGVALARSTQTASAGG